MSRPVDGYVPDLIPREVLFGNPVKTQPRISPNGKQLAYLAPVNNVLNIWVKTIGSDDDKVVTRDTHRGIRLYFWAEDSKHILYQQDVDGNENFRLYGVDLTTQDIRDLTPFDEVQVRVVDHNKRFPDELLIAMNKDDPKLHDVYHLSLTSGQLTLVAKNPGNVIGWVADAELKIRAALAIRPDGGYDLVIRESEKAEWRTVLSWGSEDSMISGPITFSREGDDIYLLDSRDANAARLVKLHIASGTTEVMVEDEHYDIRDVMVHPDTCNVQVVGLVKARREWIVLDESIQDDFQAIAKLHSGDFSVCDRDNADETWLVDFSVDVGSVAYYAFDRKAKKSTLLFYAKPDLNGYTLAPMEPVSFAARDGLIIHAYLTYPVGKGRMNLPMVVNVHGGPWVRDNWGYNPEAQWLANRGYACLQVNYRGSTGYGKVFLNAGNREWGGKMHNDLVDAVGWAVERSIADPEKVAIFGGSYGGYASLVGATFTPDLFCCAVARVGPSNLVTFMKTVPPYWTNALAMLYNRVGHPDRDKEFLEARSPLFKVDRIKIPMLIAQGANDPRVKQSESEQIVAAMKNKGIDYEYMLFPDEGHGFAKPENRLKFYAAAEKFLAKHLGGRYENTEAEVGH